MSSNVAPLLIGFAAAALLLVPIGMVLASRRLFERARLRSHSSPGPEVSGASQEWIYRPRAPREARAEPSVTTSRTEEDSGEPSPDRQGSSDGADQTHRPVEELLAAAERRRAEILHESEVQAVLRAGEITESAQREAQELLEEAEFQARETIAAAERQREGLLRESQSIAEHRAGQITEDAREQARQLLEQAEIEAQDMVAAAAQERVRLLGELKRDRVVVEETRTRLTNFLIGVLEEVEGTSLDEAAASVHDLGEARGLKTSASTDR